MNSFKITRFMLVLTVLLSGCLSLLLTSSCDHGSAAESPAPTFLTTVKQRQPTPAQLIERANVRWQRIVKAEWIEAFDFLTPEQKQTTSLTQYLQGKQNHQYEHARVQDVIHADGQNAYLRVTTLWTPHHPQLSTVKLEPGQTLTQEVTMVESWRWVDNDWMYVRAQREEEFFQEHAELLKK